LRRCLKVIEIYQEVKDLDLKDVDQVDVVLINLKLEQPLTVNINFIMNHQRNMISITIKEKLTDWKFKLVLFNRNSVCISTVFRRPRISRQSTKHCSANTKTQLSNSKAVAEAYSRKRGKPTTYEPTSARKTSE
jgi:hypothetical protein